MPALGTAPRRSGPGIWHTASGRPLTVAGAAYWENLYRRGRTDGQGHISRPSVVQRPSTSAGIGGGASARYRTGVGSFGPAANVRRAGPSWLGRAAHAVGGAAHAVTEEAASGVESLLPGTQWGAGGRRTRHGLAPSTSRASESVQHAATQAWNLGLGPEATKALMGGRYSKVGAGLDIGLALLPVHGISGALRGGGRAAKEFNYGRRALRAGEAVYHAPTARSGFAHQVLERPADAFSRALEGESVFARGVKRAIPTAAERFRVVRGIGRQMVREQGREQAAMARYGRALPEPDTPEDRAHYYWRQLPPSEHNVGGLQRIRQHWSQRYQNIISGKEMDDLVKQKGILQQRIRGGVEDVEKPIFEQGAVVYHEGSDNTGHILDIQRGRGHLVEFRNPETRQMEQVWLPKKDLELTGLKVSGPQERPEDYYDLLSRLGRVKLAISDQPKIEKSLKTAIGRMDQTIAANPQFDPKVMDAMAQFIGKGEQMGVDLGKLHPITAQERPWYLSEQLGLNVPEDRMAGHALRPMYVHHTAGTQGRMGFFPGMGGGRPRVPPGLGGQRIEMKLFNSGRLRESTHVAAEQWAARQQYMNTLKSRDVLGKIGVPFQGAAYLDYKRDLLVNPKGKPVPGYWKIDPEQELLRAGESEDEVARILKNVQSEFMAEGEGDIGKLIERAQAEGLDLKDLRVVNRDEAKRLFDQFAPVPRGGKALSIYDHAVDAVAQSMIFWRLGYIPKNTVQNIVMSLPHQGLFFPVFNVPRAAQLIAGRNKGELNRMLFDHIANEVGMGGAGSIGAEMAAKSKLAHKPAEFMSATADLPWRATAFIHEAAAAGVISPYKSVLSEADKRKLLDLFTNPGRKNELDQISARANEAMADFSRLTPRQRRVARRLFIIPGWLWAGSRYPVHFAATHPGRSAALAYAAAGEPGAPDRFKLNKPIDEYFQKDLPSYVQGIPGPGGLWRTTSTSPYSTPWEIAQSAATTIPNLSPENPLYTARTIGSYLNPLIPGLINTAKGVVETPSGETKRAPFWTGVQQNIAERLVPTAKFAREEVSPPERATAMYPTRQGWSGRLDILRKEAGVPPVKINPDAALRAKFNEEGLSNAAQRVSDKIKDQQRIDALGYKPTPQFEAMYKRRIERNRRLDSLRNVAPGAEKQRKALKIDLDYAKKLGLIPQSYYDEKIQLGKTATESQIRNWRSEFASKIIEGGVLTATRQWITEQEKAHAAAQP